MDASLGHGKSGLFGSCQYFRVGQRSFAAHLYPIEYLAPVQLEGAIYISKFQVEDKVHQFFPGPGVQLTQQIVLAIQAVAGNDVVLVGQVPVDDGDLIFAVGCLNVLKRRTGVRA